MSIEKIQRGYYFLILKQDFFKKDLWLKEAVVFALSPQQAAEIYAEAYCQEERVHNIKKISDSDFEFVMRGSHNYECKYRTEVVKELDTEIPAYLRETY